MSTDASRPRLLALTSATSPLSPVFARLVAALREAGAEVRPLPLPTQAPSRDDAFPPRVTDLKAGLHALAETVGAAIRGDLRPGGAEDWLPPLLRAVEGAVDGVVAVDPAVAARAFAAVAQVWPDAVRVAVDGDFHIDADWDRAPFDDLVTAHPALGRDAARVRQGLARLRTGGPVAGGASEARRLEEDRPTVAVSFARVGAGDVDPLLFQLSLARPETFALLFLPSGRSGIDELVRSRAAGYGLRGKRPRADADLEAWIRGAALLVGLPAPPEAAAAVAAGVPQVLFAPTEPLDPGDAFLLQHGLAVHCNVPITVSVEIEQLLPGGERRPAAVDSLAAFETDGPAGAAAAVLDAVREGRPRPTAGEAAGPAPGGAGDLEDIGGEPPRASAPAALNDRVRRAYLREIILQQKELERQIARARAGLETWVHREGLARTAGDDRLLREARLRVEGLQRVVGRLEARRRDVSGLRDRFAGKAPLTSGDREAAARFMTAEAATTLDQLERHETDEAFSRLELDDALTLLKRRLGGGDEG